LLPLTDSAVVIVRFTVGKFKVRADFVGIGDADALIFAYNEGNGAVGNFKVGNIIKVNVVKVNRVAGLSILNQVNAFAFAVPKSILTFAAEKVVIRAITAAPHLVIAVAAENLIVFIVTGKNITAVGVDRVNHNFFGFIRQPNFLVAVAFKRHGFNGLRGVGISLIITEPIIQQVAADSSNCLHTEIEKGRTAEKGLSETSS